MAEEIRDLPDPDLSWFEADPVGISDEERETPDAPTDDDFVIAYAPGRVYWGIVRCTAGFADVTSYFDLPSQVNGCRARIVFLDSIPHQVASSSLYTWSGLLTPRRTLVARFRGYIPRTSRTVRALWQPGPQNARIYWGDRGIYCG